MGSNMLEQRGEQFRGKTCEQGRVDEGKVVREGGGNKLHDKRLEPAGKQSKRETLCRVYADIFGAGKSSFLGDNLIFLCWPKFLVKFATCTHFWFRVMLRGYCQSSCQDDSEMRGVIHIQKEIHLYLQKILSYLSSTFLNFEDVVVTKISGSLCP